MKKRNISAIIALAMATILFAGCTANTKQTPVQTTVATTEATTEETEKISIDLLCDGIREVIGPDGELSYNESTDTFTIYLSRHVVVENYEYCKVMKRNGKDYSRWNEIREIGIGYCDTIEDFIDGCGYSDSDVVFNLGYDLEGYREIITVKNGKIIYDKLEG